MKLGINWLNFFLSFLFSNIWHTFFLMGRSMVVGSPDVQFMLLQVFIIEYISFGIWFIMYGVQIFLLKALHKIPAAIYKHPIQLKTCPLCFFFALEKNIISNSCSVSFFFYGGEGFEIGTAQILKRSNGSDVVRGVAARRTGNHLISFTVCSDSQLFGKFAWWFKNMEKEPKCLMSFFVFSIYYVALCVLICKLKIIQKFIVLQIISPDKML